MSSGLYKRLPATPGDVASGEIVAAGFGHWQRLWLS
jgi:hypothetical protein